MELFCVDCQYARKVLSSKACSSGDTYPDVDYYCYHPDVVEVDPVTGPRPRVCCARARYSDGGCGKDGSKFLRRTGPIIVGNERSPSPGDTFVAGARKLFSQIFRKST